MKLKHIDIACLSVPPANMRAKGKSPDIANILSSVRARGVMVPLIVRANGSPDTYEIVAGKRRYHAALAVAAEGQEIEPLPCAVMAAGTMRLGCRCPRDSSGSEFRFYGCFSRCHTRSHVHPFAAGAA